MLKVRVAVSDPSIRELLSRELERDHEMVLLLAPTSRYSVRADVLVIDDERGRARDEIQAARRDDSATRAIVLIAQPTEDAVGAALAAGASGVIVKSQPIRELLGAIRVVAQGGSYVCHSGDGAPPSRSRIG